MSEYILGSITFLAITVGVGFNIFYWAIILFDKLCHHTTDWQRARIINFQYGKSDLGYLFLLREIYAVSYDQHYNALKRLKNPIKLYGELTQKMWEKTYG